MDIQIVEKFFFWCMIINLGLYLFTALATLAFRGILVKTHRMMFGFDEAAMLKSVQSYLATYKLLITVFNFTPWLAILIIKA